MDGCGRLLHRPVLVWQASPCCSVDRGFIPGRACCSVVSVLCSASLDHLLSWFLTLVLWEVTGWCVTVSLSVGLSGFILIRLSVAAGSSTEVPWSQHSCLEVEGLPGGGGAAWHRVARPLSAVHEAPVGGAK